MQNLEQALKIFKKLGLMQGIANQLGNIGLVKLEQLKYDEALTLFKKSLIYIKASVISLDKH